MKLRNLFTVLGLAGVAAGAGVAVLSQAPQVRTAKADNATIYINVSGFGPTYGDNNEYETQFSVWAYGSGTETDTWTATPTKVQTGVYSFSCDSSYSKFKVVRSKQGVTDTWPSQSADSWNESPELNRGEYGMNFFKFDFDTVSVYSIFEATKLKFSAGSADYQMYYNYVNGEISITNHELTPAMKFKVVRGSTSFGYDELEDGCKSMFNEEADNEISVKNPSVYAIYLKPNGKLWAQIDSNVEAANWAEDFVNNVGCKNTYDGKPANWDTYAGTFASLTDGAKDVLIGAQASNDSGATYVQKAAFIHDMCVAKYEGCSVFMMREGGGSRAINVNRPALSINATGMITTLAVISVISLVAVLSFVIIKKNKQN